MEARQVEELICIVSAMSRDELATRFRTFRGAFPVDFSDDFLKQTSLDRLQHIFIALCMQHDHLPLELLTSAA